MSTAHQRKFLGTRTGLRLPAVLSLAAALSLAAGCGGDSTVGGLTNPNPGSAVDRDKGAVRDDLPVPDLNSGHKEPTAEVGASSTSGTGSNAGTGAASGQPGTKAEDGSTPQEPKATPPAKSNSGDASGGTKPSDTIQSGTPRSPQ